MKKAILLPLFACLTSIVTAQAQEALSHPVGFNTIQCLSGSDTFISVSFNRPAAFRGVAETVGSNTLAAKGDLAWAANQFASPKAHFVKILSGSKAGAFYEVTGNTANTLTLNLAGDTLAGVAAGDKLAVIPYWTLLDLLPVGNATIHQSTNTTTFGRRSQVLFPDLSGQGINRAATGLYYLTSAGWHDSMNGNVSANPRIEPDQYIIIRHRAQEGATKFVAAGTVDNWTVRSVIATSAGTAVDNPVSNLRPVPVKLKNLGLVSSGAFTGSAGTGTFARKDTLFVYDNTVAAINRTPSHIYYYNTVTSQWMDSMESHRVADNDLVHPATGCIIRKAAVAGGPSFLWTHNLVAE